MPLKVLDWYTEPRIENNPTAYFIFGDNDQRVGVGGQAKICRGKPNCIGVRTKALPTYGPEAFYYDRDFEQNRIKIDEDFAEVEKLLESGSVVYWPACGIGTGRANLKENAPETLNYINEKMLGLLKKYK